MKLSLVLIAVIAVTLVECQRRPQPNRPRPPPPRRPLPPPPPRPQPPPPPRPRPPPQTGGFHTFDLPDGVEFIVGAVRAGFSCDGRIYGYYADIANDCRIFHVCMPVTDEQGFTNSLQWSFFCGNQTMFNQESMTCDYDENVDCARSEFFYSLNNNFGIIPPRNRF